MRPRLLFAALSTVLLCSCFSPGDGEPPPLDSLYFPTGLALDVTPTTDGTAPAAPEHLFIASSDFDLQYRASALASYNLDSIRALVPPNCNTDADCTGGLVCDNASADPSFFCVADPAQPCAPVGEHQAGDQLFYPGRCASIDPRLSYPNLPAPLISNTVEIGAFATDVIFRSNQGTDGDTANYDGRLFMPVRGDATLHWIDVDPNGGLHCGQSNTADGGCDDAHRIGDDENVESPNGLRQEPEPFAIAIDDDASNIAVTNQTTGSVSLYANYWQPGVQPALVSVLGGLPSAPVGIASVPVPTPRPADYEPAFLAVYRDAAQVDLLRVEGTLESSANNSSATGPYAPRVLTHAGSIGINANSVGSDSRGIAIDDSARRADYAVCNAPCENLPADQVAACQQQNLACFLAAHQPSVYVSNRAPASLLIGAFMPDPGYVVGTSELPAFSDSIPLTLGPARVVLGKVRVPTTRSTGSDVTVDATSGNFALELRVFVVCFDSRRIYIYDPVRRVIDAIVTTGRGPYALAIDEQRGFGYVAHFTDSYLGVISLDQRFPQNYAAIVASVGVPSAPRASK
jgi:hypothetical protein